ncbi:hypothetical protein [Paenibacillus daejeonensis]|uniref:hypothetical protein n=1 Tax=Paenibacillus daejeonensis TaxID=135193 RepID=UPI000363498C|nr:hypothetical protein [Paenibacillus daejeonensis]
MRMGKFFVSLLGAALLSVSMSVVSAAESIELTDVTEPTPSVETMDAYFLNQGVPQSYLDDMPEEEKIELYEVKAVVTLVQTSTGTEDENASPNFLQSYNAALNASKSSTANTASTWTKSIVGYQMPYNTSGINKFRLTFNWTWNQAPTFTLTDKFGMAWTHGLVALDDTAKLRYTASGTNNMYNTICSKRLVDATTNDGYKPGEGIGWKYDIKSSFPDPTITGQCFVNKHVGYGQVDVLAEHPNNGANRVTGLSGTYFHKWGGVNGTLDFNNGPGVSISWSSQYNRFEDAIGVMHWKNSNLWEA